MTENARLRVLIANESADRIAALAHIVGALGHQTVAVELEVDRVAETIKREQPDVALVSLGQSSQHALDLISRIVGEAECPVVAVLPASDIAFVREAARRGIFAYVVDGDAESVETAIEIVLLRFAEYHGLQGAFGRRALIERAKGILMERNGINEREAFELLRSHARRESRKIADLAQAVIDGQSVLPSTE